MLARLRELRLKSGMSQKQLADVIGTSQQSINKYENHDVEPDIKTLIRLADCFNTSVDYLIGHTEVNHVLENVHACDLNDEEAGMLDSFRHLTRAQKNCVLLVCRTIAGSEAKG